MGIQGRMTPWQSNQQKGSIPNRLQTTRGFTRFLESLVGIDKNRTNQLATLASKLWSLRAPEQGDIPPEVDTRAKAVQIAKDAFIIRYDNILWKDKNIDESATHMASQNIADMEEMTKDLFGPCKTIHPLYCLSYDIGLG